MAASRKSSASSIVKELRKRKREDSTEVKIEEKSSSALIPRLPGDFLTSLAPMLDAKSLANLSVSSKSLYYEMDTAFYWKSKFLDLGFVCDEKTMDEVFSSKKIIDYSRLYHATVVYLDAYIIFERLLPWELYCLSGRVRTIEHAMTIENVPQKLKDRLLFIVTLSGSVLGMKYVIEQLNISPETLAKNRANILHYAVKSESIEAIDYALTLKVDPAQTDDASENAWHYAIRTGSLSVIKHVAKKLPSLLDSRNDFKENALLIAAHCGSVSVIKYLVNECKISANSRDNNGSNVLQFAALSGSVEAVLCVRQLWADKGIAIDLSTKDNRRRDATYFAGLSGNRDEVYKALTVEIEPKSSLKSFKK